MTDNELRGIILQKFYERRREFLVSFQPNDFTPPIPYEDLNHICSQLGENGLIIWEGPYSGDETGEGKITARGIDVVKTKGIDSPIKIKFQSISISQSQGVQIGSNNIQSIDNTIGQLILKIEHSQATEEEKQEAKSKLKSLLENPLITSIIGAGIAALIARL